MATTTKDDMTVTVEGEHGTVGPMALDEMSDHAEEIGGAVFGDRQLSFAVGGREPNGSSIKASVNLTIGRQLRKGDQVRVAVTTASGELLAQTVGKVVSVAFEDQFEKGFLVGCERVHKVATS